MTSRRSFLSSIIAAAAAPAIVKAEIIMPVRAVILPSRVGIDLAAGTDRSVLFRGLPGRYDSIEIETLDGLTHEQWVAQSRQIFVVRQAATPGRGADIDVLRMPQ